MKSQLKMGELRVGFDEICEIPIQKDKFNNFAVNRLDDSGIDLLRIGISNPRKFSRRVLHCLQLLSEMNFSQEIKQHDPYRIGIYFSGYARLSNLNVVKALSEGKDSMSHSVRTKIHPHFFLIHNGNIAPAHISIHHGIKGPLNSISTATSYPHALFQSYQMAAFDLSLNNVDLACVIGSTFYDDFIHTVRAYNLIHLKNSFSDVILTESVACSLISKDSNYKHLLKLEPNFPEGLPNQINPISHLKYCPEIWSTFK